MILQHNPNNTGVDIWIYKWGPSFFASKTYRFSFDHIQALFFSQTGSGTLNAPPRLRHLFGFCLMTVSILRACCIDGISRSGTVVNYVLCEDGHLDTRDHLFLNCHLSMECWVPINLHLDSDLGMENMIVLARGSFSKPFFMEAFSVAAWSIWKQRNCKIFDNEP